MHAVHAPAAHANDAAAPGARLDAMSAMAATLTHELTQPITATHNYLQACAARLRSRIEGLEELLAMVEDASAQTRRASEIIAGMREFLLRGTVRGRREQLSALVEAARPAEAIELAMDFAPGAREVLVDRIQVGQVFANLFANAADAMRGQALRRISVSARRDGAMVEVRVADTGSGLSADAAARLFEPFFTTKASGTGLGLALCRTIVEAHGGRICAEAGAGEGAAVVFTLPAAGEPGV